MGAHTRLGDPLQSHSTARLLQADQCRNLGKAAVTWKCQGGTVWRGAACRSTLHPPRPPGWQPAPCSSVPQGVGSTPGLEQSMTANEVQTHPERFSGPPLQPEVGRQVLCTLHAKTRFNPQKVGDVSGLLSQVGGMQEPTHPHDMHTLLCHPVPGGPRFSS